MWCFNKHKEKCPICLQDKKLTTQCKICSDTKFCKECCHNLCEKGLCDKCPVCRQSNWKKTKKSQILPVLSKKSKPKEDQVITNIIIENENFNYCSKLKLLLFYIYTIIVFCLLIYCIGLLSVVIFIDSGRKENLNIYWIAPIIGLIWALIIWSPCCCGRHLSNVFCKKRY